MENFGLEFFSIILKHIDFFKIIFSPLTDVYQIKYKIVITMWWVQKIKSEILIK